MMKRHIIFIAMSAVILAFTACTKGIEHDHDTPVIYLPHYGFSLNRIWSLQSGTDTHFLSVYCSGLYKGAGKNITINYKIDPGLIAAYNSDGSQPYSGQVTELPADCYTMESESVSIPKGSAAVRIPLHFNIERVRACCTQPGMYYAIPIKLTSSSDYRLPQDKFMTEALYAVSLQDPSFYFFDNRDGYVPQDIKVVYGTESISQRYKLQCEGVPEGNYDVEVGYDPEILSSYVSQATILPPECFEIVNPAIHFETPHAGPELEILYKPHAMAFRQVYYLPLSIKNPSAYKKDDTRGTLIVKVEVKNKYDKTYNSKLSIHSASSNRTGAYEVTKTLSSYENDIVELQMGSNATVAGAGATGKSNTYNDKYMRLRIIPSDDPAAYPVEMLLVTDKGKNNNSPASLELDPDRTSYYDCNAEVFVLYYRWKHKDGKYITVNEILSSN